MATTVRRINRTATSERWQQALAGAIANGVQIRQLAGSGQWVATSGSRGTVAYVTDGTSCECEAAMLGGNSVCQHRALYWHALGMLDPEPEPPAPVAPALNSCRDCGGDGYQRMATGGRLSDWIAVPCWTCNDTGKVPGKEAPAIAA